jgi:hypothetical protein
MSFNGAIVMIAQLAAGTAGLRNQVSYYNTGALRYIHPGPIPHIAGMNDIFWSRERLWSNTAAFL